MFDREMRYIAASRRWLNSYGLPGDVIGKSHSEVTPENPARWKKVHERVLRGETVSAKEDRFDRSDGSVIWVRWEARPWRSSGDDIGGVIVFAEDITKYVQVRADLIVTQQRLVAIMEAAPIGIAFSTDIGCQQVTRNAALLSQLATAPRDNGSAPTPRAAARQLRFFQNGKELSAKELPLQRAVSERAHIAPMELDVLLPTGGRSVLEASGAPILGEDGEVIGGVEITVDVTDRKRAETALQDVDRRRDEFLATLAHELRNPLAPICNGLAAMKRGTKTEEDAVRVIAMMERQSEHLLRFVDDLLEVSRIKRGKIKLVKDRVDLAGVIGDAYDMNRDLIGAAELELRIVLPDEPLLLDADAVRLTQVFANLLNNAARHTDRGGRIEIVATRVDEHAVVNVTDTGVGIAKEMLPHLFSLYSQASDLQGRPEFGLGIGLALARGLVELHRGSLEAHSEGEGRGARFIVRLPCLARVKPSIAPLNAAAIGAQTSRRVLIVDDEPDVADSLALLLSTFGADVRVARGGAEALITCAEFAPELVFLDIGMPGMDGFETARRMRESPTGIHAMLVALTGWDGEETRRRAVEVGFDRHLRKPAGSQELEALLHCAAQPQQ
ncbi:two-component system, sensor histidine kinase [Methylocystis bryophila]